ncbi:double-strand break repair protein AddB [Seohaeicola saemankumensis]|nr:double-strand break repair protein AddB [Seohaeicola saemankumensis]MCA0870452.1 double-strand break repair protein AddB [Seohaeicola saemankumensis]
MFDPSEKPRVFALPCGADFPSQLIAGLLARCPDRHLARVHLVVNTARMSRRIRALFDAGLPRLLPKISLLTELGDMTSLPAPVPALRRKLELAQLISRLLERQPDLAPRSALFDLTDSLAALMDEMQGEGVSPDAIRALDVSDLSGHWARMQNFLAIAEDFTDSDPTSVDPQARQRLAAEALIAQWQQSPPDHPIILAGSTGSRGTTMMLMQAIARLPQGAVVLPGFDFDQPDTVWAQLDNALTAEDHPQYRFRKLMDGLDIGPADIHPWTDAAAPSPPRNGLVSLALRPAPVTHAWMTEGPQLNGLDQAAAGMTLVEASSPRTEALAIALRLRQAVEHGQTAALISPDRMLTRQVSAALDRWGILPDDSAGLPLQLSPPGRFLRHVAELFAQRLTGADLLTLLKHPLTHSGSERGEHLRQTRELELFLRRKGIPFPDAGSLTQFANRSNDNACADWVAWVWQAFCGRHHPESRALAEWIDLLRQAAEGIAAGSQSEGSGALWEKKAGQDALKVIDAIEHEATHGGAMAARDFASLLANLLSAEEVRDRDAPFDRIMIWGTLEARVQGADLLIMGGLNDGVWPEATPPDPWLNRKMRLESGLLLPERRIGLSAHDFQQAVAAPEVWLTRAIRSDDAETVASRWLNRLTNLMNGLPDQGGRDALAEMRARGQNWLTWADALDDTTPVAPAPRPSPRPPVKSRPRRLSVTEIKRLIRDPYAIYAKHVLKLRRLDPLAQAPDALLRGIVVHKVFEAYVKITANDPLQLNRDTLIAKARDILQENVAWPTARKLWLARIDNIADAFLTAEAARQKDASPAGFEVSAKLELDDPVFALVGQADRIDRGTDGALQIYDYKTGAPPTRDQQAKFDKQLLIEAAMAEQAGFEKVGIGPVSRAAFIGIGSAYKEVPAPLEEEPPAKVLGELRELLSAYLEQDQGFTSRRMLHKDTDIGDYDHLARFGEWDRSSDPSPEDLT